MRGTVILSKGKYMNKRITPACAGNSACKFAAYSAIKDHPRVCGEQRRQTKNRAGRVGSPPRVRGTGRAAGQGQQPLGITPACAGNRPGTTFPSLSRRDHPRVCGEQPRSLSDEAYERGSPPRVRGTVKRAMQYADDIGITPACAGNSGLQEPDHGEYRDHPRVCGEQRISASSEVSPGGSPPRVRGTAYPPAAGRLC